MKDSQFVQEIKNLYYSYQLDDCIEKVIDCIDEYEDFVSYQCSQLFKGLSYFELSRSIEGHQYIKNLIQESREKKGEQIQQIDLFIMIMYQWEWFDEDPYEAEEYNIEFRQMLEAYKLQYNERQLLKDGVYLFAEGMNIFIDTFRDQYDLKCIEKLKQALKLEQQYNQEIQFLIGWMQDCKYINKDSIDTYLKLEKINPNYPGLFNNIATSYKLLNNKEKAEEYYLKAMKLCPKNTIILNNIAAYYEEQQNYQKSREYFKISYEINPKSPLTCKLYGRLLYKMNEIEESKSLFNEAIKLKPNDGEIYKIQAGLDQEIQLYDIDVEKFKKCLEYKPKEGYYYYLIGDQYEIQDDLEMALEYLNKAAELKLYSNILIDTYARKGSCLYQLERFEEALDQYLMSLNLNIQFDTSGEVENIVYLLDHELSISYDTKIELLDKYNGPYLSRLDSIINKLEDEDLKVYLIQKLDLYKQFLQIIAYQNNIQPNLTYQNEISHWDLSI